MISLTRHIKVQPASHNVAECIDNGVDGSMGMNIYWLAKPPLRIASIYRRIPASTPNMLVLPASMQQIVLFSGPRATSQVHPWYRCPFQFSQLIRIISIKIFKKEINQSKCEYHRREKLIIFDYCEIYRRRNENESFCIFINC